MWVLGIESSCDETSAAVLDSEGRVRSNVVFSQDALHARYGGVIPELASREHLARITPIVQEALETAGIGLDRLEGLAVTNGPGLIGSLLVGVSFARALALARQLPLVGVNHLEGHLMAPFVEGPPPEFPLVGLLVSGGHTSLYLAEAFGQYRVLGTTRDDAAGEAFDKVARLLNLGYPGGARIDALAQKGNPEAIAFPRGMMYRGGSDFSFSGLKTAVLNFVKADEGRTPIEDLAASFQAAVVDVLVHKTLKAARQVKVRHIVVSGGVSANSGLRARFTELCRQQGFTLHIPPRVYCTDNAAMIARAGRERLLAGQRDSLQLRVDARLRL
jgi:N6-L-threonylcarbamoyladenine synthase